MNQPGSQTSQTAVSLSRADLTLRLFITSFLVILTAGYGIGIVFVDHTTSGTVRGLSEEYRGSIEGSGSPELKYAKSADEMYILLHNHILSLSLVFFTVGALLYFCTTVPGWLKNFLMIEPLIAIGTTFGGIWLTRYISDVFSWLVAASGISMIGCYVVMVFLILRELWSGRI